MPRLHGDPGGGQHRNRREQRTMLDRVPAAILVILEIEEALDPGVGSLDGGTATKQGFVPRAGPSQHAQGIGGEVGVWVSRVARVLGGGRQGMETVQDVLEKSQGVHSHRHPEQTDTVPPSQDAGCRPDPARA
jgi:hypothetical protein